MDKAIYEFMMYSPVATNVPLCKRYFTTFRNKARHLHLKLSFAVDIMKREKQLISVVRQSITRYTTACIIEDKGHEMLRGAIL